MKERLFIFMENKELSTIQALKNSAMQNSMRSNDFLGVNKSRFGDVSFRRRSL